MLVQISNHVQSEITYMTDVSLQIRQHVCLHVCITQAYCRLVAWFTLFSKHTKQLRITHKIQIRIQFHHDVPVFKPEYNYLQCITSFDCANLERRVGRSLIAGRNHQLVAWDAKMSADHSSREGKRCRQRWTVTVVKSLISEDSVAEKSPFSSKLNLPLWENVYPQAAAGDACLFTQDWVWSSLLSSCTGFLTWAAGADQTTGMIPIRPTWGAILIPVKSLLVLYLQNGGVVVQDGQDDFVHVLSQA